MTPQTSTTDRAAIQKQNLWRVVYIALCGMILFTAYCSIQSLVSELYRQLGFGSLGRVCMLLYFFFLAVCSIVAPFYIKKISTKTGLVLGAMAYGNFIFAGLLTTFCTKYEVTGGLCSNGFLLFYNVVAASFVGVGGSIFWLCQATYVNDCADESTKGTFNGVFWSVFQLCQITSSTLATLILSMADQFTFFSILTIFCVLSVVMLFYIKNPIKDEVAEAQEIPVDNKTMKESLVEFCDTLKEPKYYNLFSGLFFSGLAIGTYIAFLGSAVTYIVDSTDINEVNKSIGFVFMVLAVGEVSAGFTIGKMADMYSKFKVFTATMYINEAALIFTFLACLFKSYKFAIICAFLWGYGDTAIQTMIGTQIGYIYNGKPILFSVYRVFQGAGIMFALLVSIFIPASMPILYVILMAGFLYVSHYYYKIYMPEEGQPAKRVSLLSKNVGNMIELDAL